MIHRITFIAIVVLWVLMIFAMIHMGYMWFTSPFYR